MAKAVKVSVPGRSSIFTEEKGDVIVTVMFVVNVNELLTALVSPVEAAVNVYAPAMVN